MRVVRFPEVIFLLFNLLIVAVLLASFARSYASATTEPQVLSSTTEIPAPQYAEQQLQALAREINRVRAEKGLMPLRQSSELDRVAEARAQDMANNAYYAHKSPSGQLFDDVMRAQGIQVKGYACENLNMAETSDVNQFISSWMNSPSHRQCLLDRRTQVAGYAITKIIVSNGVPVNQYVVVAIYQDDATE